MKLDLFFLSSGKKLINRRGKIASKHCLRKKVKIESAERMFMASSQSVQARNSVQPTNDGMELWSGQSCRPTQPDRTEGEISSPSAHLTSDGSWRGSAKNQHFTVFTGLLYAPLPALLSALCSTLV